MDVNLPVFCIPSLEITSLGATSELLSRPAYNSLKLYSSMYASILYKHLVSEVEINIVHG